MTQPDINTLSFEAAMAELETIVRQMDQGGQSLDDAIANYTRGAALKSHCEKKLAEAQLKVEQITLNEDGKVEKSDVELTTSEADPT